MPESPMTAAAKESAAKARVPAGHPLEMWEIEEAAQRCRISEESLRRSPCPRAKFGTRLLFDPIETIAFMRLHLTHTVSEAA